MNWLWITGGMTLTGKQRVSEKSCPSPSPTLSTTNPTRTGLISNAGLRCERSVTNQPAWSGRCVVGRIKIDVNECEIFDWIQLDQVYVEQLLLLVKTRMCLKILLKLGNFWASWGVLSQVGRCPMEWCSWLLRLATGDRKWWHQTLAVVKICHWLCPELPLPDRVMSADKTSKSLFNPGRVVTYNNTATVNQRAEIHVMNWSVSRTTPLLKTLFKWDQQRSQAILSRPLCSSFFSVPVATLWWGDLLLCRFIGNPLETKGWRKT